MIERRQQAFASPELHWLNYGPGSFYAVRRATLMQNLLSMPVNQDKGNPALLAHEKSSKPSPHTANSNVGTPKRKGRPKPNNKSLPILSAAFGVASVMAVAPVERVGILMQCQSEMMKAGRLFTPYKGMKDCLLRTIKHDGFLSLWRGNSVNVVRVCAFQALPFALAHFNYANYVEKKVDRSRQWMLPFAVIPVMLLFYYPLDYARVRLASDVKAPVELKFSLDSSFKSLRTDTGTRQFSGVFDVLKKTLKWDGIQGIYRGYSLSWIGLAAYYMAGKELRQSSSKEQRNQKKSTWLAFAVSSFMWYGLSAIFYPVQTVYRRMMMTSGEAIKYRGPRDALYQIVKTEGASSLYKGLTPYMICAIAKDSTRFGFLYMSYLGLKTLTK